MPIQTVGDDLRADRAEFALPLLDQMRRRDHQHHLIVAHLPAQRLDNARSNGNRRRPSHRRLAGAHRANEQDAVALLKTAHHCADHMLLCAVEGVFAFELDPVEEATHPGEVEAVKRIKLRVQILRQRPLVGRDERQERLITFHLRHIASFGQQRERSGRLQAHSRLFDLPIWITRRGFHLDTSDLLHVDGLASDRDAPMCFGVQHRTVGNACRQHQCEMPRTRCDDGLDLRLRRWDIEQRLKAVRLPRSAFLDEPQSLFRVDDIRCEDETADIRRWRQLVDGFGLKSERTRRCLLCHD
jgi:hypothetical protein